MDHAREQARRIQAALRQIELTFGGREIHSIRPEEAALPTGRISSGCISLDWALGVGGFPRSQILEIFGPESSGKTTIALHALACVQRDHGVGAFIDTEHALDSKYASSVGVNPDTLLFSQPRNAEEAFEIVHALIRSCAVDLIVLDSVAALSPRTDFLDATTAFGGDPLSRVVANGIRRIHALLGGSECCLILLNQTRSRPGIRVGDNEVSAGGPALKYHAALRIEVRPIGSLRRGNETIGIRTGLKVVRNKLGASHREAEFDIRFGAGIHLEGDLFDLGLRSGAITKAGGFYEFRGQRMGLDRDQSTAWLHANPQIRSEMEHKLRELAGLHRLDAFVAKAGA